MFVLVLGNDTLLQIAKAKNCTVAQVSLAFCLTKGVAVVTKTEKEIRMTENLGAAKIKLNSDEMCAIDKINLNQRHFWTPYDSQ